VADHRASIATARPELPASLNDRATRHLGAVARTGRPGRRGLAGAARQAAVSLSASAQETNPHRVVAVDIFLLFALDSEERMFSRTLVDGLIPGSPNRPWAEMRKGKEITVLWLSHQLRPYGIRPGPSG